MELDEITKKAGILIEALPYIMRFKGATFVVKYGGAFMDDPDPRMRAMVAQDISFLAAVGINVVVVHGGGKAISRAMSESGLRAEFKNGLRVTDERVVGIVESVLNSQVNPEICELLKEQGCPAQSLPGNEVLRCRKMLSADESGAPLDLGYVGNVVGVDAESIQKILDSGRTPVISPIAKGESDMHSYNTNADAAAAAVASALKARRLVFLCDVPGLMRDPKDAGTLISHLKVGEVGSLKKSGVICGGMTPKVDSAVEAIRAGVRRVHFVDGHMPHSILLEIFNDSGIGTEIVHESVAR